MTDVEPMLSYIKEMGVVVAFLINKPNKNTLEQRVVDNHKKLVEQLEAEPNNRFVNPYLTVAKG